MSDERIRIVLNPAFDGCLETLGDDAPVWVIQSERNNAVADTLWKSGWKNLTTFRPQDVAVLLWTIDDHHPGWRKLEFHGLSLDEAKRSVMAEFGGGTFEAFGAGFIFEREMPSNP